MSKLTTEFVNWYGKSFPVESTYMKVFNNDHLIDDLSAKNIKKTVTELQAFSKRLTNIDTSKLNLQNKADYFLLTEQVKLKLFDYNVRKIWQQDAYFYVYILNNAIEGLMLQVDDSTSQVSQNLLRRLKRIPLYLSQAKQNLISIDKGNLECTLDKLDDLQKLIAFQLPTIFSKDSVSLDSLNYLVDIVSDSLLSFRKFITGNQIELKTEISNLETDDYLKLLKILIDKDVKIKELTEAIKTDYQQIYNELVQIARGYFRQNDVPVENISPGRLIRLMDEEIEKEIPLKDQILDFSQGTLEYMKLFIEDVTNWELPVDFELKFDWKVTGYKFPEKLLFLEPVSLLCNQVKFRCRLTPVTGDHDLFEQLALLRGYNKPGFKKMLLVEAFPVHYHYWFKHLKELSPAVRAFPDQSFLKGWPYYFALVMVKSGYGGYDPKIKFVLLKKIAQIYFYAYTEIEYYANRLERSQLTKMFTDNPLFPKSIMKHIDYKLSCFPAQDLIVYWGIKNFQQLEKEYQQKKGTSFAFRNFLRLILKLGPVPFDIIHAYMKSRLPIS